MLPAGVDSHGFTPGAVSGRGPRGLDPRRVGVHHGLYGREAMPRPACHGKLRGALGDLPDGHRAFGSWEVSRTKPMDARSEPYGGITIHLRRRPRLGGTPVRCVAVNDGC